MLITGYRLYRMTLNCLRPFKIASGVQDSCHTLLLEVWDRQGRRGFGEAIPIPLLTDENLAGCEWTLTEQLLPLLRNRHVLCLRELHRDMSRLTRAKSARCAVDVAVHNLQAQILGVPLSKLLGSEQVRFETNYSIGICDLEETVELALHYQEAGYSKIKLKVGLEPDYDVSRIVKLSQVLGTDVQLRLDANGGWTRHQALSVLRRCEQSQCRIEFVEQPVAREDFEGLRWIRERTAFPVVADESVQNEGDALRLLEGRCVDVLNLKLMKTGGLLPALRIVALAKAFRCQLMIGGMVGESEISVGAAASIAASLGFSYADLDADILLRDGPFAGVGPAEGHLKLDVPYRTWDTVAPVHGDLKSDLEVVAEWAAG
jgi:L-Ala-D/L-Glu epimerase / N-acetyl-D-glutamate racemase